MNNASPATKTHLWPSRSPTRPAGISANPNASAYPETIHDSVAFDASRLLRIVGIATLTIVVSSSAMNAPASRTTSANHLFRSPAIGFDAWAEVVTALSVHAGRR